MARPQFQPRRRVLSAEELRFFRTEGYLVIPSLMDPALCAAARDRLWEQNESSRLRRDEPSSWVGPLPACDENDEEGDYRRGYRWQLRSCAGEPLFMDLLPRTCWAIAEQLLGVGACTYPRGGDPGAKPMPAPLTPFAPSGARTRGIYCTLPRTGAAAETEQPCEAGGRGGPPRGGHWDNIFAPNEPSASCLLASAYIDDVPEGGGGFVRVHKHVCAPCYCLSMAGADLGGC